MSVSGILSRFEASSSLGMFAKDTGGCLLARLGLSRSKDETREISVAELTESALFYFSAPALAKLNRDIFSRAYKIDKNLLGEDLKNIPQNALKNATLAKFGQIFSTFGLILPLVYAIAPVKNYITLKKSGKDKFTSVVGLEEQEKKKDDSAKDKMNKMAKVLASVAAGTLALGGAILGLSKNEKIYNKIEPFINSAVKHFGFTKECDLRLLHYGALIYPVSILGYFKSARDKYEKQEYLRRFSITVPLLFFGDKLIQNPIYKGFDRKFGTDVFNKGNIKSYSDIFKMPKNLQTNALKTKNRAYTLTYLINTIMIAGAIALLNRIETKKNFEKDHGTIKE